MPHLKVRQDHRPGLILHVIPDAGKPVDVTVQLGGRRFLVELADDATDDHVVGDDAGEHREYTAEELREHFMGPG